MSKYFIFSHHLLNILHLKKEELVKTNLFQNQPLTQMVFNLFQALETFGF